MGVNGIYGLSGSGLDVESMVRMGMMTKESQYNKMQQTYTLNEWKKEAYLEIYDKVNEYNTSTLSKYKYASNMNARSATSSNSAIKVNASASAPMINHTITVDSTATNAYLLGTKELSSNKLTELGFSSGDTINFSFGTDESDLKSVDITVDDTTTVYDLVSKVNSYGINVRATFDSSDNTFSFYNKEMGSANRLVIQANNDGAARLLNAMGLKDTGQESSTVISFDETNPVSASGKNAKVYIDGEEIKDVNKNVFERKGITYDISGVTTNTSANVSVSQDIDGIIDKVKSFVEDYNKLLDDLYKAYRETPNKSYKPLTDAQKNEMTEEQIKKWEEKAKAGMLYHDGTLRKLIDDMRNAISDKVTSLSNSNYDTAYSIGISTKGLYGELKLDEDKLRKALVDDPDSVYNVFGKLDSTADKASDSRNGIAQRLTGGEGSVFYKATESIKAIAGTSSDTSDDSTLNVLLRNLQTRMSNFKSMMTAYENKLYKKYDAMESALAGLGNQMNYVSNMFSS
ncbi:MAG: flagellar filament capping protein FliD [Selenomonadaceae bacterium]|nr:flagellar filament capping protein FliD [Selenomonadaceae bacterium]